MVYTAAFKRLTLNPAKTSLTSWFYTECVCPLLVVVNDSTHCICLCIFVSKLKQHFLKVIILNKKGIFINIYEGLGYG